MLTTIDVVVLELCNNTVAITPIMRPATGFERILFSEKAFPAVLPGIQGQQYEILGFVIEMNTYILLNYMGQNKVVPTYQVM